MPRSALPALLYLALLGPVAAQAEGDAEAGEKVFRKCAACHQLGPDAENRVGPHLNGIHGRVAGTVGDFAYSDAMVRAGKDGLTWSDRTLDAFIKNPKAKILKTRMNFTGLDDAQDRADLLAFLRRASGDAADAPEEQALDPAILALVGDVEYGAYLAGDCTTCHQPDGADDGIPSITGWPVKDFVVAMHAYKNKLRPHPVMQMMAGRLTNEEIAALAVYFKDLD